MLDIMSLSRALQIASNPNVAIKGSKQMIKTFKGGGIENTDYSSKPYVLLEPGLACAVDTYSKVANNILDSVNIIPQEQRPSKGIAAIAYSRGMHDKAIDLLQEIERKKFTDVLILSHSEGSPTGAYARILDRERNKTPLIKGHMSVAGLLGGSSVLANMPGLSHKYKSVRDYDPNSEVMRRIQAEGKVEHAIITLNDGLLLPEEMESDIIENRTELPIDHFDPIVNDKAAEQIGTIFKTNML